MNCDWEIPPWCCIPALLGPIPPIEEEDWFILVDGVVVVAEPDDIEPWQMLPDGP